MQSSLPTRERGSKLLLADTLDAERGSLPTRERGSKLVSVFGRSTFSGVAPHAGAWIETFKTAR